MTIPRADHLTAMAVRVGLRIAQDCDIASAARFMAMRRVPIRVALRVLTRPDQRRTA